MGLALRTLCEPRTRRAGPGGPWRAWNARPLDKGKRRLKQLNERFNPLDAASFEMATASDWSSRSLSTGLAQAGGLAVAAEAAVALLLVGLRRLRFRASARHLTLHPIATAD